MTTDTSNLKVLKNFVGILQILKFKLQKFNPGKTSIMTMHESSLWITTTFTYFIELSCQEHISLKFVI